MKNNKIMLFFAVSTNFLALALLSTTPRPPIKAGTPGYVRGNFMIFSFDEHYCLLEKCDKTAFLKENRCPCADCKNLIEEQTVCENSIG